MLPNFLVIGAAKSGTTTLCDMLAEHEDVFVCTPKEPHFFSRDCNYERGIGWYESLFDAAGNAKSRGDGSTTYSMKLLYPHAAERIAVHLPSVRLIYIVREPFKRLQSQWMHDWSMGRPIPRSLAEAVRTFPSLVDNSLYWSQLSRYHEFVPADRILVLFLEEMLASPRETLRKCFEFLEVDPAPATRIRLVNRNPTVAPRLTRWLRANVPYYSRLRARVSASALSPIKRVFKRLNRPPELDPEARKWVAEQLRDDAAAFLHYCGRDGDSWQLGVSGMGLRPVHSEAQDAGVETLFRS